MYMDTLGDCCGATVISDLSAYKNAEGAMKAFCKQYTQYGGKFRDPGAFIVFAGVERLLGANDDDEGVETEYGGNFATYIAEHELGTVVASPERVNRLYHNTHVLRVWCWAPDVEKLGTWWTAHKAAPRAKKKA